MAGKPKRSERRCMNPWQLLAAKSTFTMRNEMISVAEAEQIIQSQIRNYGTESVPVESSLGRVLAENLLADRDLPPFNRVTMDGIAIQFTAFEKGIRSFKIKTTQAAGETPVNISAE